MQIYDGVVYIHIMTMGGGVTFRYGGETFPK